MLAFSFLGFFGVMMLVYGTGFVLLLKRSKHDREHAGQLNRHDGRLLMPSSTSGHRREHILTTTPVVLEEGRFTRVSVSGVELARSMGFRLQALTRARGESLDARLVVDGTRQPDRARRLFAGVEIRDALATLCGAAAPFRAVNLYPDGDLIVDVGDGPIDDFTERLLRFTSALDQAVNDLEREPGLRLGSASGSSGSPATFSIEIRS